MYFGFLMSLTLHLGLIGWALVSFASTKPLKTPEIEPVEVAIISPDDLIRLKQGDRSSKNLETRAADKPNEQEAKKESQRAAVRSGAPPPSSLDDPPLRKAVPEKPAAPREDAIASKLASLSEPDPKLELQKKAEEAAKAAAEAKREAEAAAAKAKAEEEAQLKAAAEAKRKAEAEAKRKAEAEAKRKADAEAKRKAEAERKRRQEEARKRAAEKQRREEEERKKQFDPGRIAALLNKVPDSKAPPTGSSNNRDRTLPKGPEAGAPEGRDDRLTASQLSMIGAMMRAKVRDCWNINAGLDGAQDLAVEIEIRLTPDGYLDGTPRVVDGRSDPFFRDAANSALRALKLCEPYDLPREIYKGGWDHMVVTFDPSKMF